MCCFLVLIEKKRVFLPNAKEKQIFIWDSDPHGDECRLERDGM
jgi:hypothetical protein